jgi:hypothetical protein
MLLVGVVLYNYQLMYGRDKPKIRDQFGVTVEYIWQEEMTKI